MIDTTLLEAKVQGYYELCKTTNRNPTYKGIALMIGVSSATIGNVVRGEFNGHKYTAKPHITRCISNNDFELLQRLFDRRGKE